MGKSTAGIGITPSATTAPDGTNTGTLITESTATTTHYIYQTFADGLYDTAPRWYEFSFYAKPQGRDHVLAIFGGYDSYTNRNTYVKFDLLNLSGLAYRGAGGFLKALTSKDLSVSTVENGWYKCSIKVSPEAFFTIQGLGRFAIGPRLASSDSYAGNSASGVYIWGAQVQAVGETSLPYQRVESPSSYDQSLGYYYLIHDVDDNLLLTTSSNLVGEAIIATRDGVVKCNVNFPSGTTDLSLRTGFSQFLRNIHGLFVKEGTFTEDEETTVFGYFKKYTNTPIKENAFINVVDLNQYFRDIPWITSIAEFPTTQIQSYALAFYNSKLTSIPALSVSSLVNGDTVNSTFQNSTELSSFGGFYDGPMPIYVINTWRNCRSLTSFPSGIDFSQVDRLQYAWMDCTSLTTFPEINISSLSPTYLWNCWQNCFSLSSFPLIDTSHLTNLGGNWHACRSLSSFPLLDTGKVTSIRFSWYDCRSLSSFPQINTEKLLQWKVLGASASAFRAFLNLILVRLQILDRLGILARH